MQRVGPAPENIQSDSRFLSLSMRVVNLPLAFAIHGLKRPAVPMLCRPANILLAEQEGDQQ